MSKILKIGVAVDNYKVKKFVAALDNEGYDCKQTKLNKDVTLINFKAADHNIDLIKRILKKLEIDVNLSN